MTLQSPMNQYVLNFRDATGLEQPDTYDIPDDGVLSRPWVDKLGKQRNYFVVPHNRDICNEIELTAHLANPALSG